MDSRHLLIEVLEAERPIQCRVRTRFLVHGCRLLAAFSRGRGARKLSGSLASKGSNPIPEGSTVLTNHLPKAQLLLPSHWG